LAAKPRRRTAGNLTQLGGLCRAATPPTIAAIAAQADVSVETIYKAFGGSRG
jgi:hypothetical protein